LKLRSFFSCLVVLAAAGSLLSPAIAARSERLAFRHVALDLPGPPARIVPADLNGDGLQDLVVVLAYTEIEETGEDRIENLVQITQVIPTLFKRRELRLYLAEPGGDYAQAGTPLDLPFTVLHLELGPPGVGVVALTDEGLSRLLYEPDGEVSLRLEPVIQDPSVLAGTGSFFATLELAHDFDSDGVVDLMIPTDEGLAIYLARDGGLTTEPVQRVPVPLRQDFEGRAVVRWYPLPEVRDLNGDGLADLLFESDYHDGHEAPFHLLLGSGDGRFRPLRDEPEDCHDVLTDLRWAVSDEDNDDEEDDTWPDHLTALRDLDGDGRVEAVITEARPRGDSMRKELKDAKRPIQQMRFHRLTDDLRIEREPYDELEVVGHVMDVEDSGDDLPFHVEQFMDLDADGREDLVTLTLRFSVFQAIKILTTKKIGIGIDFHVYAQDADGHFHEVKDLDLSEKLKLDLNKLEIGRLAWFAGDFNGDGLKDFVHLGRGDTVTLHAGQVGCRYPKKPDLSIDVDEQPDSLELVRIEDLDGDGRSDLRFTRPLEKTDPDTDAPVRIDLYLSGDAP